MRIKNHIFISLLILLLSHLYQSNAQLDTNSSSSSSSNSSIDVVKEIQVGVILDMGSLVGKVVNSCISMAISDFCALNRHSTTRIVLHIRDSEGEPLRALSAALDLLENIKVQAIIGPETSTEAMLLAALGDKAKIPILSFARSPSSSTEYPNYLVQLTQNQTIEFDGIASVAESFQWRNVILIYEDGEIISNLAVSFQEKNIRIAYKCAISLSATDEQILVELHNLKMTLQTTIFVVHVSPPLASRLFLNVKKLGMMSEGYGWIITDKTMDLLHSMDSSSVLIESMQGVLGFKSYIPPSRELHNFTLRWSRKFRVENPNMETMELNVFGIWAYDAIWALAKAVERVVDKISQTKEQNVSTDLANIGASQSGSIILNEILQIRFRGLSGEFQLMKGSGKLISRAFEIVNIFGKGERRVGYWTLTNGITKEMFPNVSEKYPRSSSTSGLEAIVWPGVSTITPKGWLMHRSDIKLKIGIPVNQVFKELIKVHRDPQTRALTVTGFCIDVFKAAIDALPSDVPYEFVPFEYSNGEQAGTYNDLLYQVYLKKLDAVVGDITITANRSLYVDFTIPYTDLGVGTIIAKDIDNKSMWIFLKPLHSNLWLTSAAFFILTGFVVWVIEHPINEAFQGSAAQQIGTVFWFSFSTLVFAHREKLLSNLSRFTVIVWVFAVFILTSSYTATLSSLLTVQQIQGESKENYIGYGSLAVKGAIVNNMNFEDERLIPYNSTEEYANALSRGTKNGGVAAIIDEIPYIKIFLATYPYGYAMIGSESTTNGFAFAFQKGSPLVPEMSRAIMKLREDGKLKMMEKKWFKSERSSLMFQDSVTSPTILNLDSFGGLFLISGLSSALALVIFLIKRVKNYITNLFLQLNLVFILKYLSTQK